MPFGYPYEVNESLTGRFRVQPLFWPDNVPNRNYRFRGALVRNLFPLLLLILLLNACATRPATQFGRFDMATALVRHLASTPSYMSANKKFAYEVYIDAGTSGGTKLPPAMLTKLQDTGVTFAMATSEAERAAIDLARMGISPSQPRNDGDYDLRYSYDVCLRSGGYYGSDGVAIMRRNAAGWLVISTSITSFSHGRCR